MLCILAYLRGGMACATCHVYVNEEWLDKLPTKEDGEEDMLDMAFEPKQNSRLSCQLIVSDVLIIGAGPTGLFCAHQLGIIGLNCEIVDNLDKAGGQCIELYPDKPIYDIPAIPECTGEELTNNLLQQIKPFDVKFHLNERVEELKKVENRWHIKTSGNQEFDVASIVIAGGVGSFEPRKFPLKECEKFEGKSLLYSIKDVRVMVE